MSYGDKSTSPSLSDLGSVYFSGANAYRLVRASAALALTANGKFIDDASVTTLSYSSSALSGATSSKALGVVSANQVTIASGDFFLVQVQGIATVTGANTVSLNTSVTTAASGLVANVTGTFAATVPGTVVGTAMAAAAGANATIRLQNLI
jgi:hypothetical protein